MKNILKKSWILFSLFSVAISFPLKAVEIDSTNSKRVALNAFSRYSGKTLGELKIIQKIPVTHQDTTVFHVYNFENGFVIVAANDVSEPVLGFGLTQPFDFNDMPPALQDLLENYKQEIVQAKRQNTKKSQGISEKWTEYLDTTPSRALYMPATWLVETTWGQDSGSVSGSNIAYNHYCPLDAQGHKTVLGCGAVALAQILNYWRCRVHPQGTARCKLPNGDTVSINFANQTYNWGGMIPNEANTTNALFLYHCAVALNSIFGSRKNGGTESYPTNVPSTLTTYFGFTDTIYYKNSYSDQNWIDSLKKNIDNRRPVFYAGSGNNGGHGWVIDGYNSGNYFHCNWGWRGSYNDWYLLSNLTAGGHNLNNNQRAIVDIYPTYYSNLPLKNMTITSNTYTGHTITVENSTIQNNANVILDADCVVEIFGNFEVPVGATLEIK